MKFWEFYRIIIRRKTLIAILAAATCTIIFLATTNLQRGYMATSQIMPSDAVLERPILTSVDTNGNNDQPIRTGAGGSQLSNLMSLITSRTVAERTIQMLNLEMDPNVLKKKLTVSPAPDPSGNERGPDTDIIQINVTDDDRQRAVRIANAVAMVFANYYQEISHQNAVSNSEFLREEVTKAEVNLNEVSAKLTAYKRTKGLSALPEGVASSVEGLQSIQQQRDESAAQLSETQQKLASVREQLRHESPTRVVAEGTSNSAITQQLETQVASLKAKLIEAQSKYYDTHPTVQDLKQSLADAESKLRIERNRISMHHNVVANPVYQTLLEQRSTLEADSKGLAARVSQLNSSVSRAQKSVTTGEDVELAKLQRDFEDAQTLASNVKAKLHQATLDEKDTSTTGAIRLVDRATWADGPIGRSRSSYLFMGLILSLIAGIGIAFTLESLDNRIRSNVDVEELLSLPVNALIPSIAGRDAPSLPKITYLDPLSPLAEAYRFLRTDLLLSAQESGAQTIMVATAKPGQGGTTTVANLAISLAMDGKRVVLVDADMRRPTLHRIFKAGNETGLSNVLTGDKDLDEVLVSTEIQNLLLLPAGSTPLNSSELLGSRKMGEVVAKLKAGADFVVFDTPSAIAFTDTVVLSKWIDGVLLVVRANQVPRGAELQVRKLFNKAQVKILGVVLNDVQPTSVDSYYYHSHYYANATPTTLSLAGKSAGGKEDES